jgi:hypothetical protein
MFSKALWCKPLSAKCYSLRPPFERVNQIVTFGVGAVAKSKAQRLCKTTQSESRNFGFQFPNVDEGSGNCTNAEILAFEQ